MSVCPSCKKSFRTLEDEVGTHACPSCGHDEYGRLSIDIEAFVKACVTRGLYPDGVAFALTHEAYKGVPGRVIDELIEEELKRYESY